ncbi:MAG: T9SS type A sorting domain-containing protein [Burkholderiales bacterium]|nr:T9SS type A sorting domain-containing protein [Bacteroidia bacterium]
MKNINIIFLLLSFSSFAQTLNVPVRPISAMNGSQFVAAITALSFTNKENVILQEVIKGNVPNFYRNLSAVTSTAVISGVTQSITYYVIPDYLAIGCDTNYFLCPMSPIVATKIADSIGCTLPTRKMVNDIYAQATLKLPPLTIPASGSMTTVQAFDQHNSMVYSQRSASLTAYPLGTLVGGDKKDVVISNMIYTTANRVVIYGWHTSVGNPIQPMSNVHSDTYMDYSHGMRFIQNDVLYNGTPTTIKAILQSSVLNPLLSDEGVINPPEYPYGNPITSLSIPKSFAVINKANNTLEIKVKNDVSASHYKVYTSTNGTTFNAPVTLVKSNLILSGLTGDQVYFVKIAAYNASYSVTSAVSELLAAVPCTYQDSILVVNGFDRTVTGNTFDFIKQHGGSLYANGHFFSSASNEAIQDGLINLVTYKSADWILGKESTANETFSSSEQTLVANFLKQGGKLLVSGSEIAWDLDNSGTAGDKIFITNYLKATYAFDAPNSQASTWYKSVNESSNSIFNFTDTVYFDNGSNGTYNVDYPDVIAPVNGGISTLKYTNNSTSTSAVYFSGMFPSGTANGKVIYLGFPLESVYNTNKRHAMFQDSWNFFFSNVVTVLNDAGQNTMVVYPNPTNGLIMINTKDNISEIEIIDLQGQIMKAKVGQSSSESVDLSELKEGIYFLRIKTGTKIFVQKICKVNN